MAPHPHSMAHPAAVEFATQPDPGGLFARAWLAPGGGGGHALSPLLPDAYVYEPHAAPPAVLDAALQLLKPAGSAAAATAAAAAAGAPLRCVYPTPFSSLARARTASLECVRLLHRQCRPPPSMLTMLSGSLSGAGPVGASPSPGRMLSAGGSRRSDGAGAGAGASHPAAAALEVRVSGFLEAQAVAGVAREWGMCSGWPLVVEEDGAVLQASAATRAEEGWEELAIDGSAESQPSSRLTVYAQQQSDLPIRPHVANIALLRHWEPEALEAVGNLRKYATWDLSFARAEELAPLDVTTQAVYLVGDPPPPPFSFVFPQRDFVFFRHVMLQPAQRATRVVLRSGAHALRAPETLLNYKYVRGEVIGAVGFLVRPVCVPPGARLASPAGGGALVAVPVRELAPAASGCFPVLRDFTPPGWPLPPAEAALSQLILYSAGDPKGSIPSYIINYVAKRTPRKWCDRLTGFCEREAKTRAGR